MSRPRITPEMAVDAAKEAFRLEVKLQRVRFDMTQGELADLAETDRSVMSRLLANPDKLAVGRLRAIIKALDLDPLTILRLLGYTDKDIRKLHEGAA